jgi:hypothetical protein
MTLSLLLAASAAELSPFMTFSRSPAFDPRKVKIEVGLLRGERETQYSFKRTVGTRSAKAVWWTDTRRCPAARLVLHAATRLEMPGIFVLGLKSDEVIVTADGIGYELQAGLAYSNRPAGKIRFNSNVDTPLAHWVDESLRTLEPCWTKEPPKQLPPGPCGRGPEPPDSVERLCSEEIPVN